MSTIINIRGTNGSGKTTAVKSLINFMKGTPMVENGKTWAYNLKDRVYVLGRYETPTGGCDGIRTQQEIYDGIRKLAALGNVVYEGVIISAMYGKFRELEDELKPQHHYIWACLDTPLETCIAQTIKRRETKGNMKPFNPDGLKGKFRGVETTRARLEEEGRDVRTLSHQLPLAQLLNWLGEPPLILRVPERGNVVVPVDYQGNAI
jgi:hypothetical protein